jgi:hypothetical protein
MNVILICDPFKRIIGFWPGGEGCAHDSTIVESIQLEKFVADGHFILFDAGASLTNKCITPYRSVRYVYM